MICELEEAESGAVLRFLFAHESSPEFQMRHRWQDDSVVFLDNRCAQPWKGPELPRRGVLIRSLEIDGGGKAT